MKVSVWTIAAGAMASTLLLGSVKANAQNPAPKSQASVVMVGHSLINYEMPYFVDKLASSKGLTYTGVSQVKLGASLRVNLENCRGTLTPAEIADGKVKYACSEIEAGSAIGPFDTLILTDANNSITSNRVYNRTDEAIADFIDVFHSRNAAGRVLLFTTWESILHPGYGNAWPDRQAADLALYEAMAQASTTLSRARGRTVTVEVVPVDIALRDLIYKAERGEVPGITSRNQVFLDDVHMNVLGNYFVACVVFAATMNRTPEGGTSRILDGYGNTWVDVPTATAAALQRIAWDVVSTYRGGAPAAAPKAPGSFTVN